MTAVLFFLVFFLILYSSYIIRKSIVRLPCGNGDNGRQLAGEWGERRAARDEGGGGGRQVQGMEGEAADKSKPAGKGIIPCDWRA